MRRSPGGIRWVLKRHVEEGPPPREDSGDAGPAPGGRLLLSGQAPALWRMVAPPGGRLFARRSGEVDALLRYRVEKATVAPTLADKGSCAELQWPELLYRLEEHIYISTWESPDIREGATRRYQEFQDTPPSPGVYQEWLALVTERRIPRPSAARNIIGTGPSPPSRAGESFPPVRHMRG